MPKCFNNHSVKTDFICNCFDGCLLQLAVMTHPAKVKTIQSSMIWNKQKYFFRPLWKPRCRAFNRLLGLELDLVTSSVFTCRSVRLDWSRVSTNTVCFLWAFLPFATDSSTDSISDRAEHQGRIKHINKKDIVSWLQLVFHSFGMNI